ncbi:hypothetical protein [Chryseosolibacter indicus]|uniref:PH domain-containing protein n=1 Tax=Chryseosolibacter indicus TaxID=2782351 RepID=A0ABS5VYQ8_9BACT|nr:hypothetical protein [Chryseosolibacter indicus]MBT1706446.1 hypothetical protein [Chryseosolibacter indicus]
MESNRTYYYLFKYSLLGVSILLAIVAIVSWIAPELMTVNGQPGARDLLTTLIFALIAVIAFLVFLLIRDKFAIVELGNQTVKIKHNGQDKAISWLEVEEVKLIQFIYPPLYKIRIKDSDETIWFNTESNYISVNGFVIDTSDMGDLIKKKKRELGI